MTNLLEQGATWLDRQRHNHLTWTVVYQRGELSVQVQATAAQTQCRIIDEYGQAVWVTQRDYLIRTEDLILDGNEVLPQRGDRIRDTQRNKVFVYEVMGPGGGEPDWRYWDRHRRTLRIHTKHVGTEDA